MSWLDPIERALDERETPVSVFVRDDDGGWADDRLLALLGVFAECQFPVDLAVIPTAVGARLARQLIDRSASQPIGIHQHGFAHTNHEPSGRPCEFGPSRAAECQRADLAAGRLGLLETFGPHLDAVFTPPWNRCTTVTGECLVGLGVAVLSRDRSAGLLGLDNLAECPIAIDWFAKARGARLHPGAWADLAAREVSLAGAHLGVMLHHSQMDAAERCAWAQVLRLLARHPRVNEVLMRDVARPAARARSV